ncbi:MAG TPA: serine/threonine-protein kinase [Thermoanaerobaculia bacterium]|nr:serine/threonine-protein kinase [Thermoanaerobaculia bacterium]
MTRPTPTPTPESEATVRVDSDARPLRPTSGAQFAPGTIIAGRYRISGILGSGGMGEVYRADDTKLDQPVALKFLPARLARDPVLLARLHDEVRLGRQVAHPNVCRIYDIIDWDGAHFVAMEYVDGEDLSRLLRRIGRIAHDKAVDITRGIAAGLAAAHAKGILHRDLKPANIMIDSRGDARVMDFGLALASGEDDGTISGTPAYMAPELFDESPATVQSDLYALGLVMYELFTGKRVHNARTMPERMRELTSDVTTPSSVIRDIDPAVERVILRCLHHDPAQRPQSAREVILALPGGDPLAAAMAAGETPSPRVVAAAGTEGTLRPAVAWTLLSIVLVLLATLLLLAIGGGYLQKTVSHAPLEVQAARAAELLRNLGVPPQQFNVYGLQDNERYKAWLYTHVKTTRAWDRLRRGLPSVTFWLREENTPLQGLVNDPYVGLTTPPQYAAGSIAAETDARGRLFSLKAIPAKSWKPQPLRWDALLAAAGLSNAQLTPSQPGAIPESFADARAAWSGKHPDDGTPIRVEAAAYRGVPVFFRIIAPWDDVDARDELPFGGEAFGIAMMMFQLGLIFIAVLLAWRNLRQRRGDRAGAIRLGTVIALMIFAGDILYAPHEIAAGHEVAVFFQSVADGLLLGAIFALVYLALEPFVRRRWPDKLISWARLLAGNWRDPMVGRDILIGLPAGLAHTTMAAAWPYIVGMFGHAQSRSYDGDVQLLDSTLRSFSRIPIPIIGGTSLGLVLMTGLMLFTIVLRRRSLAVIAVAVVFFTVFTFASRDVWVMPEFVILTILYVGVVARYGLLSICAAHMAFTAIFFTPLPDAWSWYTLRGAIPLLFVVALAIWAFRTSLGAQRAFAMSLDD